MNGVVLKRDGTWGAPTYIRPCPPHRWGYRSLKASPHRHSKPEPVVRCSNCGRPQ